MFPFINLIVSLVCGFILTKILLVFEIVATNDGIHNFGVCLFISLIIFIILWLMRKNS
jgi:hypothetical protein